MSKDGEPSRSTEANAQKKKPRLDQRLQSCVRAHHRILTRARAYIQYRPVSHCKVQHSALHFSTAMHCTVQNRRCSIEQHRTSRNNIVQYNASQCSTIYSPTCSTVYRAVLYHKLSLLLTPPRAPNGGRRGPISDTEHCRAVYSTLYTATYSTTDCKVCNI